MEWPPCTEVPGTSFTVSSTHPEPTGAAGHLTSTEQPLTVKLISDYIPPLFKVHRFLCIPLKWWRNDRHQQTHKPSSITTASPQKSAVAQTGFLLLPESFHTASSSIRHTISTGRHRQQQNKTSCANCLQKVSLWFLTVYSFKLKLKVMFCVPSFRTARIHLSTCCCWEIYIFTCWMCKVDHCKLKIPSSCHFPCSLQIWWASQQSSASNEYACLMP